MTPASAGSPDRGKAIEMVVDLAKQLITLATGVLALTMTFLSDIASTSAPTRVWLVVAWLILLSSVLAGVGTMMAATGHRATAEDPDPYAPNLRLLGGSQILLFVIGLGFVGVAVVVAG